MISTVSIPVSIPTVSNTLELNALDGISLTPDRYAYLYKNMERAKIAHQSGKLSSSSWELLRSRFAEVHRLAISIYGTEKLSGALKSNGNASGNANANGKTIRGTKTTQSVSDIPMTLTGSHDSDPKPIFQITPSDYAKSILTDEIINRAMSLSWDLIQLTGVTGKLRFPIGDGYGLICFIDNGDKITEVTKKYITIVNRNGNELRFYNKNINNIKNIREV